jgi:predicted Ser/Thr protein kinase
VKDVTSGMARFNEYIPHASTYINDERWEDERAGQQATQRKVLSR